MCACAASRPQRRNLLLAAAGIAAGVRAVTPVIAAAATDTSESTDTLPQGVIVLRIAEVTDRYVCLCCVCVCLCVCGKEGGQESVCVYVCVCVCVWCGGRTGV